MAGERSVKIKFLAEVKKFVADTKVAESALSRWESQADKASKSAGRAGRAFKAMIGPGLAPAILSSVTALVGVGVAAASAGAAMGVFGGVAAKSQSDVSEAATKVQDLRDKMTLLSKQAAIQKADGDDNTKTLKKQRAAALELQARLALLPAPVREATKSYIKMQDSWQGFVDKNSPATFGILQRGYALVGNNIGKLQPLFDIGRKAASLLLTKLEKFASGGGLTKLVAFLSGQAGPSLEKFGAIASNIGKFIGSLFSLSAADGQTFLDFLVRASDKLAQFGSGGGLEKLLDTVGSNAPAAGKALVQIAEAAVQVAKATAPLAPVTIAIATALASIIAALPPQVITTLVAAWIAYTAALTAYNAVTTVVAAGAKVAAAAQWLWNAAMTANPIGLIIAGIVLLIAGIVLLWKNSETFRNIVMAVWGAIKVAAGAVVTWFQNVVVPIFKIVFNAIVAGVQFMLKVWKTNFDLAVLIVNTVVTKVRAYINALVAIFNIIVATVKRVIADVQSRFNSLVAFVKSIPSKISTAARGMFDGIKSAFRSAINFIVDKWNNLSFTLPSINVPGFGQVGGFRLDTPNIPRLASGGWAQPGETFLAGERGPELLTAGRGGAFVNNAGDTAAMGGMPEIHVYIGDRELTDIVDVRVEHGNRQTRRRAGARVAGAFA